MPEPLYQHRYFPVGVPLNETLETPKFNDVETGVRYLALLVEMQGDPAVPFYAGDGVYRDFGGLLISHA
jgi:hypothetical protein